MEQVKFVIEHHAALYGLLAKGATEAGLAGHCALGKATAQYGLERGQRMAQYAQQEGIERTMATYSLFKEWRPPQEGQMVAGESLKSPEFVTSVRRCEWVETWKKYGMLECGKAYCTYVDKYLVKGFCPDLVLDQPALQSHGDPCCIFNWGYDRTPEVDAELARQREQIGEKYVRGFDFHTAHLYSTIRRVLMDEMGETGEAISRQALDQFSAMFGAEYRDALLQCAADNGWAV